MTQWEQAFWNADRELTSHMRSMSFMHPKRDFVCWSKHDDAGVSFVLGERTQGNTSYQPIETFKRLEYADYGGRALLLAEHPRLR